MAMIPVEKNQKDIIIRDTATIEMKLYKDEVISCILYALAHIKDTRLKCEMITSVHSAMNNWASGGETKARIVHEQYSKGPIVAHSVTFMRETNPGYQPNQIADESLGNRDASAKKNTVETGRGVGVKTIIKGSNETLAREALSRASGSASDHRNDEGQSNLVSGGRENRDPSSKKTPIAKPSIEGPKGRRKTIGMFYFGSI